MVQPPSLPPSLRFGGRRKLRWSKSAGCMEEGCDEALSQLEMLVVLYPEMIEFSTLSIEYATLGRKINSNIDYVDNNWRT